MIRYALSCDQDHAFDSWFQSAEAFDKLQAGGMVGCPDCGSTKVAKSLMAPQVRTAETAALTVPAGDREKALVELRRRIEENSEYVGLSFAAEARAIHDGEKPGRAIWGEARADEAKRLIEDGIPVAPLPFLPSRKAN